MELVSALQEWRKARKNTAPPGAKILNTTELVDFDSEAIGKGDNQTDHDGHSSSNRYMGWSLKRSENETLLVKICPGGNPHDGVHCQAWLGEDLGFAEDLITTDWASDSLIPFFIQNSIPSVLYPRCRQTREF